MSYLSLSGAFEDSCRRRTLRDQEVAARSPRLDLDFIELVSVILGDSSHSTVLSYLSVTGAFGDSRRRRALRSQEVAARSPRLDLDFIETVTIIFIHTKRSRPSPRFLLRITLLVDAEPSRDALPAF